MMNFLYLMHLVQTKNDLNRKRRRFYSIMSGNKCYIRLHEKDKRYEKSRDWANYGHHIVVVDFHPAFSKVDAKRGYEQAKKDMKAMTKHMKEVRKALGAKYFWDWRGAIAGVRYEGNYYNEKQIAVYAMKYRAESILLGKE